MIEDLNKYQEYKLVNSISSPATFSLNNYLNLFKTKLKIWENT
ncbi:hypothetical protein [Spiroplasma diminutum]|nr:hypothetical protein [Spiroplasma diminutum]